MKKFLLGLTLGAGLFACNSSTPAVIEQTTRAVGTTFTVAASGATWTSPAQVSAYAISPGFKAGDKILFKAGETFTGAIWFKPNNPGSSANPIIVGSYVLNSSNAVQMITGSTDTRRATLQINDLTQSGMYLENVGGYDISHLFVRGPGIYSSQGDGIVAYN